MKEGIDQPVSAQLGLSAGIPLGSVIEEAVEEGLMALGQAPKNIVLYSLELRYGVPRADFLRRPDALANALRSIFGPGAGVLEYSIKGALGRRLGIEAKKSEGLAQFIIRITASRETRERAVATTGSAP